MNGGDHSTLVVRLESVTKHYRRGTEDVAALSDITMVVARSELVALIGPSGSGKTTLLNLLCGWEAPDAGKIHWFGSLSGADAIDHPWSDLAIVPQGLGLTEELTVSENVALPERFRCRGGRRGDRVDDLLVRLGLERIAERPAVETSLGEQQRTAVARAVVGGPRLVLADEPTAHQDATSAWAVLDELRSVTESGGAVVMATHDPQLLPVVDRIIRLADGRLVDE